MLKNNVHKAQLLKEEKFKVLGYIKPTSLFYTLEEWGQFVNEVLDIQAEGFDTRGGEIGNSERLVELINQYFWFQLHTETERYELLTRKNILDFIEDFVNHRFWGIEREFESYFPDISKLRFSYFYSRGDIEPYVLLDEEYTTQLYGSLDNIRELHHYTSPSGLMRLQAAMDTGETFDISTFTAASRPFFRTASNLLVTLKGNVKAGFRSDIKSVATDSGRRACNMYRLEYPGDDLNNICYELETCTGDLRTSLWNEYIAEPIEIISVEEVSNS